jgi:hypothetical protein
MKIIHTNNRKKGRRKRNKSRSSIEEDILRTRKNKGKKRKVGRYPY